LINTHVSSVHQLDDLSIDPSWDNTQVSPNFLPFERSPFYKQGFSFLTAEFGQGLMSYINRNLLDGAVTNLDPKVHGDLIKFLLVFDLKSWNLAFGRSQKNLGYATGMV
jgi:hypothetical protein